MDNEQQPIPDSVDFVNDHLDLFFAEGETTVFHELVSDIIHCHFYFIKPAPDRPFNLLMTGGMSSLPMQVPDELPQLKFGEVMILLPDDWKLEQDDFASEANYWPIRTIKRLARFPHENNTWLGWGHTIPFWSDGDDNGAGHGFEGVMLIDSITMPEEFITMESDDKVANIYSVIPLYKEEMDFKLANGADALLEKFDEWGIDEIVAVGRKNVCAAV